MSFAVPPNEYKVLGTLIEPGIQMKKNLHVENLFQSGGALGCGRAESVLQYIYLQLVRVMYCSEHASALRAPVALVLLGLNR